MGGRRRHRFRTGRRRIVRVYQHLHVGHGEDALATANLAFVPIIVDATSYRYQFAFGEGELEVGLGDEVELGSSLAFVRLAGGGCDRFRRVERDDLENINCLYYVW